MMKYKRKNSDRIMLYLGAVMLVLFFGIYLFQKKFYYYRGDFDIAVYPALLQVGDTLYFRENSPVHGIKKWTFGDGNFSLADQGYHQYKKPGFYQVTYTVNDEYTQQYSIEVKQREKEDFGDYFTEIDAPSEAMQYEHIVFRAVTEKATMFSWKFGESGSIDAKDPFVIYEYKEAGDYEVFLYTDETAYPVVHQIRILPSFKNLTDALNMEDTYRAIDFDFKEHLQQIALGENFNFHYNYLVNKYLCNNENVPVTVNTDKRNSFYYYCMGLRFDRKAVIQSVKVGFDEQAKCVSKVAVVQISK
ncbi:MULTISPECIES: PKD domain-containing protein [unclassified Myroides]|uniref:PKD domain-containing protein n=1 Tax=unclassified Myroides TaxID=2642485 RepID=UPI003D2F65B3